MEASLVVCVLAALLATGACLQCEVCFGPGDSCTGSLQTCAAGEDFCALGLTETTVVGVKTETFFKTCITSSECNTSGISMNLGSGMMTRTSVACCLGDACNTTSITMPPADTKANGWRCHSCYALNTAQCAEQTIACTGSETQCIEAAGTITSGGNQMKTIMKGCVTESICAQLHVGSGTVGGITVNLTTAKCTAANGVVGVAPGPAGLLLPALAGLFLLKLLS